MQNKFCKALSNSISFRIPGDTNTLAFNPCCFYDEYIPFHETIYKKHRRDFINATDFLPGCYKCKLKESWNGTSLRKVLNNEIPDDVGEEIYKLEIVLDTTCNAACIQCGELQSSLWRKEVNNFKKIYHIQAEHQIDDRIDLIKKNIDINKIKLFHFWGGEPLLTDTHLKFISEIENPQDVSLIYTTNCSIFPSEDILKLWEKFKKVKLLLSIDGIEEQFEYIRWPLRWEKIKQNLNLFKTQGTSNMYFNINCVVLPFNILHIEKLTNWTQNNFTHSPNGNLVTYNFIRGEGTLDLACAPESLREVVYKKMGEDYPLSRLLKEVSFLDHTNMVNYLEKWDKVRKLNWRQTFSDTEKFF